MNWSYKDANRDYWSINATKKHKIPYNEVFGNIDPNYYETEWNVNIRFSITGKYFNTIWETNINTQFDEPILLIDILTKWANSISALTLQMTKYAKLD